MDCRRRRHRLKRRRRWRLSRWRLRFVGDCYSDAFSSPNGTTAATGEGQSNAAKPQAQSGRFAGEITAAQRFAASTSAARTSAAKESSGPYSRNAAATGEGSTTVLCSQPAPKFPGATGDTTSEASASTSSAATGVDAPAASCGGGGDSTAQCKGGDALAQRHPRLVGLGWPFHKRRWPAVRWAWSTNQGPLQAGGWIYSPQPRSTGEGGGGAKQNCSESSSIRRILEDG